MKLVLWLCLLLASEAFSDAKDIGRLKVGVVLPFSGPQRSYGYELLAGVELALDDLKQEDKNIFDHIILIKADDKSRPSEAKIAAEKLVKKNRVSMFLGSLTQSSTIEVAKVAQQYKKPLISPASAFPGVTEVGSYVFRSCDLYTYEGKILASFAAKDLSKKRAAVLMNRDLPFTDELVAEFEKKFKSLGGRVVAKESYKEGSVKYKSALKKIFSKKADFIFAPSTASELLQFMKQAKTMGHKITMLGTDMWDFLPATGFKAADVVGSHYYTSHFSTKSTDSKTADFIGKFKEKMKRYPSALAAMGYDSMSLLISAYKRARSVRSRPLITALKTTKDAQSLLGPMKINASRNIEKPMAIMKISSRGLEFTKNYSGN